MAEYEIVFDSLDGERHAYMRMYGDNSADAIYLAKKECPGLARSAGRVRAHELIPSRFGYVRKDGKHSDRYPTDGSW